MNSGEIYFAIHNDRGFLKLVGALRHPLGPRLCQAINKLCECPQVRGIVMDLQELDFMDSTCLGLLARVATCAMERGWERPVMVCTNPEMNRVLHSMGFDQVFTLIANPTAPLQDLTDAASLAGIAKRPDPELVLNAHRALCDINEKNRQLFQTVIEQLECEVAKERVAAEAF